ncbi:Sedlin [Lineolata rhizophorae]|uniref:Sedlin n=1 Tax=Lineolata rhizophorae TaxID=578093 RepID=A0A6A6NQV9_9PEZI|nr:Sedlin [Lineolata rhizophorae]
MSYYFAIVGTKDNPLFEHEFGTFRQGGDGIARFRDDARHMNQFVVHSSLDMVEELQWTTGQMYLKNIDRFHTSYISAFLTPTNIKFLLLTCPDPTSSTLLPTPVPTPSSTASTASLSRSTTASSITNTTAAAGSGSAYATSYNPTAPATEDAIKNFFMDVFDAFVKTSMSPFYALDRPITSPIFRARVAASAKKYL